MRLVLGSDLHGQLPDVPPCDILVLAGDIMPHGDQGLFYQTQLREWLEDIPAQHIVATWGNHDWPFYVQKLPPLRWNILVDDAVEIRGLRFYGTPWSLPFYEWAWQAPEASLAKIYSHIPENTHVLISHTPPFGFCDKNNNGEHTGSRALFDRMAELPCLQLVVCGHIHEARGSRGLVVNASSVGKHQRPRTQPWVEWEL